MPVMTIDVEGIVARMKSDPPTGSRDLAYRLNELWEAYPRAKQDALKKAHSYWSFPELPDVRPVKAAVLATLINSEWENYDVSPCWEALDRGLCDTTVKRTLCTAKRAYQENPKLVFRLHLSTLLTNRKSQRGWRAVRKEPITEIQKRSAAPAAPHALKEPPMPLCLREPTQSHARVRAHSLGLTELEYLHHLVDSDCRTSGTIEYVEKSRRRDLRSEPETKPESEPEPVTSTVKPENKVRRRRGSPSRVEESPTSASERKPPLHERLRMVIGRDTVSITEAIQRLKAHGGGWLPKSKGLKAYISMALSTHTEDMFERVKRGKYKVQSAKVYRGKDLFEDLGSDVSVNPFASAAE